MFDSSMKLVWLISLDGAELGLTDAMRRLNGPGSLENEPSLIARVQWMWASMEFGEVGRWHAPTSSMLIDRQNR
jgi:hypothetical protein